MKKKKNLIKVSLFILLSLSIVFANNSFLPACQEKPLNDTPKLTVHERAFSIILLHEGTDYDCTEWNYGTGDDKSALTWGPYGATVGWKNEVRGILKIIHNNNSELLMKTFDKEFP
ncbi:MAG: hypothetical protein GY730_10010, partial [bacterium]|nr:hypothetical protein [bacterium]